MLRQLAELFRSTDREVHEDTAPRQRTDAYVELLFAVAHGLSGDLGAAERTLLTAATLDPQTPQRFFEAALHRARSRYTLHPFLPPDYRGVERYKWLRLLEASRLLRPRGFIDAYGEFSALRRPSDHHDWVAVDKVLAGATGRRLATRIDALPAQGTPEGVVTHAAQRCADERQAETYEVLVRRSGPISAPYRAVRAGVVLGRPDLAARLIPDDGGIEVFASWRALGRPLPDDWAVAMQVLRAHPGHHGRYVFELAGELGHGAVWQALSELERVEDRYNTNSHFSVTVVDFMDAALCAVLQLEGIDATAARVPVPALA